MHAGFAFRTRTLARRAVVLTACAAALALQACGPYTLKGRVIQGDVSSVAIVDDDDRRLGDEGGPGLSGVGLKLTLEPARLNRKLVAQEYSADDGSFELPVDEAGAGLLEFEAGILARRRGFQSAEGVFMLPGGSKRVLIILAPGRDTPGMFEDEPTAQELLEQYR